MARAKKKSACGTKRSARVATKPFKRSAQRITPTADRTSKAKLGPYLGNGCHCGQGLGLSRNVITTSQCGRHNPFHLNGDGSVSTEWLLKGLSALPSSVQEQIYQHVAFPGVPQYTPTVWVTYLNKVEAPNKLWYKHKPAFALPTLENKGGDWMTSKRNQSANFLWPFCYAQGFAQKLHELITEHPDVAANALDNFLQFLGSKIVVELQAKGYRLPNDVLETVEETMTTIDWLKSLQPYHPYLQHLSLDLPFACDAEHQYFDPMPEFVKVCQYVHDHLPNVKSIIFWLHITSKQLVYALKYPQDQAWVRACKLISVKQMEVKLRVVESTYIIKNVYDNDTENRRSMYQGDEWCGGNLTRSWIWAPDTIFKFGDEDKEGAAKLKEIFTSSEEWPPMVDSQDVASEDMALPEREISPLSSVSEDDDNISECTP